MTTSIPEAPRLRTQLGLSLLLAARRLLRRRRAQPPRRDGRRWSAICSYLVDIAAARGDGRCSPSIGSTASARSTSAIVDALAGLSRHGPGARRQRRLPAGPARRLRLRDPRRDARVLRRAARRIAATPRCSSGSSRSGGARVADARPARRGPVGAARHARACTPSRASCAGPPATASRASPTRLDARRARAQLAQPTPTRIRAFIDERCWNAERGTFVAAVGRRRARREPAAAGRARLPAADDPRFVATVTRDRDAS